jgi:hypothetical protein
MGKQLVNFITWGCESSAPRSMQYIRPWRFVFIKPNFIMATILCYLSLSICRCFITAERHNDKTTVGNERETEQEAPCVLCAQCCECFWIVKSWLPLRFSLTFICLVCTQCCQCLWIGQSFPPSAFSTIDLPPTVYLVSCVSNVASVSGLTNLFPLQLSLPLIYHLQSILCLVYPMLPVSLDCPFSIAPSVFSTVYITAYSLSCVLCAQCCQCVWLSNSWFPLWVSPAFLFPVKGRYHKERIRESVLSSWRSVVMVGRQSVISTERWVDISLD